MAGQILGGASDHGAAKASDGGHGLASGPSSHNSHIDYWDEANTGGSLTQNRASNDRSRFAIEGGASMENSPGFRDTDG